MGILIRAAALLALLPLGLLVPLPASDERAVAVQPVTDPLPSWKDGPNKRAITAFVKAITSKDSPDFVPVEDRIATFDNDGTLSCEQPTVEIVFTLARLKAMAAKDPSLKEKQPFKAALEGDKEYLHKAGLKALLELVAATHGNMTQDEFDDDARAFFKSARHPKFDQTYPNMTYLPMVELLRYLGANGFQTWICSGGFADLMRIFAQDSYGIPPSHRQQHEKEIAREGRQTRPLSPERIAPRLRPGRQAGRDRSAHRQAPDLRCGQRALRRRHRHATLLPGKQIQIPAVMVNHDDEVREFSHAEKDRASLNAAEKHGWRIVSMKNDWQKVFAFEK